MELSEDVQRRVHIVEQECSKMAIELYLHLLQAGLGAIPELKELELDSILAVLGTSDHQHQYAVLDGKKPGLVRFTFTFDGSDAAVKAAIELAAKIKQQGKPAAAPPAPPRPPEAIPQPMPPDEPPILVSVKTK